MTDKSDSKSDSLQPKSAATSITATATTSSLVDLHYDTTAFQSQDSLPLQFQLREWKVNEIEMIDLGGAY